MAFAETKYNLALKDTLTDKKIRLKPWYEERLRTKHIKSLNKTDTSKHLQGKNWLFIKDGLDDFRDGLPPLVEGDIMLKGTKGPSPNLKSGSDHVASVKQPAVRNRFSKHQICFSRQTPLQQQRRDHIDEIEYGLTQHPLALYPHLEDGVPPEVFEDIVDILDPEMNLMSDDEDSLSKTSRTDEESGVSRSTHRAAKKDSKHDTKKEETVEQSDYVPSPMKSVDESGQEVIHNPYRLFRKDDKDKKDKKKLADRRISSPSKEEHIQNVTKEFCDWVAGLGGESNNIEESTIMSLFASGYETKPALSVPIHVVELTNVPPELRMSVAVPPPQDTKEEEVETQSRWTYSGGYEPTWVKFKYGAWYLPSKTWKKMNAEDPLMDPKELKNQELSDAKKKSTALNQELANIHGSEAFINFIDRKSTRKPQFLNEVEEIQRIAAEEERRKQEADLAAKQKRIIRKSAVEA